MKPFIERTKRKDLDQFIEACAEVVPGLEAPDWERIKALAIVATKYYKGNKVDRDKLRPLQETEARWYASVADGNPDLSIYTDTDFLAEAWACWVVYSIKYLKILRKPKTLPDGKSILDDLTHIGIGDVLDLGCGVGFTTGGLKDLFPFALVAGTQMENTAQFKVARGYGILYDFKVSSKPPWKADLIFASEYFEHFQEPVEHLKMIVEETQPKALIIANSFAAKSAGHWPIFQHDGKDLAPTRIGRQFNKALRDMGFVMVETNLWNNRPHYWKKVD